MGNDQHEFVFDVDLDTEELRRRAEVVRALGDDWDPSAALESERAAYDLLYSELDEEQQETYRQLVRAGVLPYREVGPDAA